MRQNSSGMYLPNTSEYLDWITSFLKNNSQTNLAEKQILKWQKQ